MKLIDRINEQRKFDRKETSGVSWEVRKPTHSVLPITNTATKNDSNTNSPVCTPKAAALHRSTRSARRERGIQRGKGDVDASPEIHGINVSPTASPNITSDDISNDNNTPTAASEAKGFFSRLRAAAVPRSGDGPTPAEAFASQISQMTLDTASGRRYVKDSGVEVVVTVGTKITISQQA